MDALLRRRQMMMAGGSPTPPGPSTTVPYIRGGADGSYIDTGITPDSTTRVIIWARNWNPATSNNMLFGYMDSSNNTNGFSLATWATASTGRIGVYYGVYNNPYVMVNDAFKYLSGYHKYELNAGVFKVDDVTLATAPSTTISTNGTIHLFGRNTGGTHNNTASPIDICACKIYKGDVLVRDYAAVNSPSVGLYDAISDTLFTNAGNGSFTYGEFNKDAYIPLEYIESNGSQYFDSGVKGTAAVQIVSKFRIVGTNNGWPALFGTYSSGTGSSYFKLQFGTDSNKNSRADFNINSATALRMYDSSSSPLTGRDVTFIKTESSVTLYENNAQIGTQKTFSVGSSWKTNYTFAIGTSKHLGGFATGISYEGRIYYFGIGAIKNFVPAIVGGVAGMYDTYYDLFYPSASGTSFTAGPEL